MNENIQKETMEKKVKICSWLLIALAVYDVFSFVLVFFQAASLGLTADVIIAMAAMSLVSAVVGVLCKVFLSVKGFKEVKGENKGTGYIKFTYVLLALQLIIAVLSIVGIFSGTSVDWLRVCIQLISVCVLFFFALSAKQLHEKNA